MEKNQSRHSFQSNDLLKIAVIALSYFMAHQIAFFFPDSVMILMAIWPAGGIGLAALLLNPRRLWPFIIIVLFISGNSANLMIGRPLFNSVGFMIANMAESLGCAIFIRYWCGDKVHFTKVRDIIALVFAGTVINAGTAIIGAGTAFFSELARFWKFWATWTIGDGLGIILITPFIVSFSVLKLGNIRIQWKRFIEGLIFLLLWCSLVYLVFQPNMGHSINIFQPYLMLIFLIWAALRFHIRVVSLAVVLGATLAITSKAVSHGPLLWGGSNFEERLLMVQIFIGVTSIAGFFMAASFTETREAEETAKEEQARLRALGDNIPDGMVFQVVRESDGDMRFIYLSAGVERLNGVLAEDVLRDSKVFYGLFLKEDLQEFFQAEGESMRHLSSFIIKIRIRKPDGQIRWMQLSSSPRLLPDGRILWDGIQLDITEQKLAEEALFQSNGTLEAIINVSPLGVVLLDIEDRVRIWNPAAGKIFGWKAEEVTGKLNPVIPIELKGEYNSLSQQIFENGQIASKELVRQRKDRSLIDINLSSAVLYDSEGKPRGRMAIVEDISERKTADLALRHALLEKEILLKELQHRVKNSLNIILSLINLEMNKNSDEKVHRIFAGLEDRIHSISAIYDQLYQDESVEQIDLKFYIKRLINDLSKSYLPDDRQIKLEILVEKIHLDLKRALPLGLIINELIINALKYAFPGKEQGIVTVELKRIESDIFLCVTDNGAGMGEKNEDFSKSGMGLRLVEILTKQLGGVFSINCKSGTKSCLVFAE